MIPARDTFLHLLADNLTSIPVHNLRRDPDNPGSGRLQSNAVNVEFLMDGLGTVTSTLTAIVDIVHDDERTAVDWVKQVWDILSAALYTKIYDYTSGTPVATGWNLSWTQPVSFRPIYDELYCRRSCTLTFTYHF
jgi:hypothetical protein